MGRPSSTRRLDGRRTYRLVLPPNPPAKHFWAVDVDDAQTRSFLQTADPHPSAMSLTGTVATEDDGSTVLWFGPERWSPGSRRRRSPGDLEPVEGSAV